jgi:hypothetical protein
MKLIVFEALGMLQSKLMVDVLAKARQAERGTSDGQPEQRLLTLISMSDLIG